MSNNLSRSAQSVQKALEAQNLELNVIELSDSTRTAADAVFCLNSSDLVQMTNGKVMDIKQ
jgi:signal recognition particle receptor subunit beta